MTPTVFVDANVLIAGSASRSGASRVVLAQAEFGMIKLVVTRQVLMEAERNVRLNLPEALPMLTELLVHVDLQILDDPTPEQFERWLSLIEAKDAPILEAAVHAGLDYFLTLNDKDFTPTVARVTGLRIQSPGEFVQNMREILGRYL